MSYFVNIYSMSRNLSLCTWMHTTNWTSPLKWFGRHILQDMVLRISDYYFLIYDQVLVVNWLIFMLFNCRRLHQFIQAASQTTHRMVFVCFRMCTAFPCTYGEILTLSSTQTFYNPQSGLLSNEKNGLQVLKMKSHHPHFVKWLGNYLQQYF